MKFYTKLEDMSFEAGQPAYLVNFYKDKEKKIHYTDKDGIEVNEWLNTNLEIESIDTAYVGNDDTVYEMTQTVQEKIKEIITSEFKKKEIDDIENALLAEDNYKEDYPDIWEKVEKFLNSDYEWEVSTHEDSRL